MINFINVEKSNQLFKPEIQSIISNIIDSGQYIDHKYVNKFEHDFAKYCEASYCVSLNSGTDALRYSLMALGITSGEVLTVSFTFAATIMSILSVGATPKFVDVNESGVMDVYDLQKKINVNTKAIIPVHFMGHPCDMKNIVEIAKKYNIPIVEDACQAVGGTIEDKKIGSFGDVTCYSFFPTKNLSCIGDGGAIVTNNRRIYEKIITLRNFGRIGREEFVSFGLNSRLDEIQAAILSIKLPHLDKWLDKRRLLADKYTKSLPNGITHISPIINSKSAYHLYCIYVDNNQKFVDEMLKFGIDCRMHYSVPVHRQKFCESFYVELPKTDELSKHTVSLPLTEFLDNKTHSKIINVIKKVYNDRLCND